MTDNEFRGQVIGTLYSIERYLDRVEKVQERIHGVLGIIGGIILGGIAVFAWILGSLS